MKELYFFENLKVEGGQNKYNILPNSTQIFLYNNNVQKNNIYKFKTVKYSRDVCINMYVR